MMSLHRMSAGKGYEYLTKSVARSDVSTESVRAGATALTAYYTETGTPPGRWLGSGLAGLAGDIEGGDVVDEEQMAALFGEGKDPTTGELLGRPYQEALRSWTVRTEERVAALGDLPADQLARESARIAREERAKPSGAVAGFDCTFAVPKSVSALWALSDVGTQSLIVDAHHQTIRDVIALMESEMIFTRVGAGGIAQVDTRGVVAAGFDHWDTRAGDPHLHTHVVIANRVQGLDGKWRTIDSSTFHRAAVAASETYDSLLADRLTRALGTDWVPRTRRSELTVCWEISGVPVELLEEFSTRSSQIRNLTEVLKDEFRVTNGREPSDVEVIGIRQQATLMERPAKETAIPLVEASAEWRERARGVIDRDPAGLLAEVQGRYHDRIMRAVDVDPEHVEAHGRLALLAVQAKRATWTRWNLEAEAQRQTRSYRFASPEDRHQFINAVVDVALDESLSLAPPELVEMPELFRRHSGESTFVVHGSTRYSSDAILGAEAFLLEAAATGGAPCLPDATIAAAIHADGEGLALSEDQAAAVAAIGGSGRHLDVLIGPAGTGKTTTMRALRTAWELDHGEGSVVGLAPSAVAAEVLGESLGLEAENTAKWIVESTGERLDQRTQLIASLTSKLRAGRATPKQRAVLAKVLSDQKRWSFRPGQLVIVDEASLAGTLQIGTIVRQAHQAGAKVLLVGDHAQLSAVESGGALALLANESNASVLDQVWRFEADWEREASLGLRTGRAEVLDDYTAQGRIREGSSADMLDAAYDAWLTDTRSGSDSLLIGADNATVAILNRRARADLVALGHVESEGVPIADGGLAGVGDLIVTRQNNRELACRTPRRHLGRTESGPGGGWVRNGDTWRVLRTWEDGSLTVQRHTRGNSPPATVTLPAWYVADHVQGGYARTAHRAQGATVDTAHAVVTDQLSREVLYVAMTRGRRSNVAYVAVNDADSELDHGHHMTVENTTAHAVLEAVLSNSGAQLSATETMRNAFRDSERLDRLIPMYEAMNATITDDQWQPRIATLVHTARAQGADLDAGLADSIVDSPRWPQLRAQLRTAINLGQDPDAALVAALSDLASEGDPAAQLQRRITGWLAQLDTTVDHQPLIAGMVTPANASAQPGVDTAMGEVARLIHQRAHHLATTAVENREPWVDGLDPWPEDPFAQAAWWSAAVSVAAYRERWDITGDDPLGEPIDDTAARRDRRRVATALAEAHEIAAQPPPTPRRVRSNEPLHQHDTPTRKGPAR